MCFLKQPDLVHSLFVSFSFSRSVPGLRQVIRVPQQRGDVLFGVGFPPFIYFHCRFTIIRNEVLNVARSLSHRADVRYLSDWADGGRQHVPVFWILQHRLVVRKSSIPVEPTTPRSYWNLVVDWDVSGCHEHVVYVLAALEATHQLTAVKFATLWRLRNGYNKASLSLKMGIFRE